MLLVLSCLRQCGLNRYFLSGWRVREATMFSMELFLLVLTGVVIFALKNRNLLQSDFTAFCNESLPNCTYYSVPYKWDHGGLPACAIDFPMRKNESLTLVDFGLLSSLAYESRATQLTG